MIHQNNFQADEPFPAKCYIRELETELAVANYTVEEAEESFQCLRQDYQALQKHADVLEGLLRENGISYPRFEG